ARRRRRAGPSSRAIRTSGCATPRSGTRSASRVPATSWWAFLCRASPRSSSGTTTASRGALRTRTPTPWTCSWSASIPATRAAAASFEGAAVSTCYADVDGHVGYQLVGRLPARPGDGSMPVPGWTGEYDWTGLVPAEANPNALDPPGGVVENSNDRPSSDPRSAGYAGEWDPGFRGAYLTQRLGARDTWDLAATRVLQTDFASAPAARFRE